MQQIAVFQCSLYCYYYCFCIIKYVFTVHHPFTIIPCFKNDTIFFFYNIFV